MRIPKKTIITMLIIFGLIYALKESYFYFEAKQTLTDKSKCFTFSTKDEEGVEQNQTHYIAEECQIGNFNEQGLRTVIRIYQEGRTSVLYEKVINIVPPHGTLSRFLCMKKTVDSCELLMSDYTADWLGRYTDCSVPIPPQ